MKIKHFYSETQISERDKQGILNLIHECDFIYGKKISVLINPADEKSLVCLFDDFGEPCGFVSLENTGNDVEICELFVGNSDRSKGYGKLLINQAIKKSKEFGYDSVSLMVAKHNAHARKFYDKQKFIAVGNLERSLILKKYNSSSVYEIAGILYELENTFGVENMRIGLEVFRNKDVILKYFSQPDDQKIEKRLKSKTIQLAISMLEGKEVDEDEKNCKKAKLCVKCFEEIKTQRCMINNSKEKVFRL